MKKNTKNPHRGSDFDDFLKEDGIYRECHAGALKEIIATQLKEEMKKKKLTSSRP